MNKEEIKFTVDQLRKDKIIYATEVSATAFTCMLGFWFSSVYFESPGKDWVNTLLLFVGVGYTFYMGVGNYFRLKKIRKLEKEL